MITNEWNGEFCEIEARHFKIITVQVIDEND